MSSLNQPFTLNMSALSEAMDIVKNWEFSLTKQKLCEIDYAGWSAERAEKAEQDYKKYLVLTKICEGFQPVPNGDIDRFWHEHILDTRRYKDDCEAFFGYFLHHYPYFGMRGEEDNENWMQSAEYSNFLWKQAFAEELYSLDAEAMKYPQGCPGAPQPMKCPQGCPG